MTEVFRGHFAKVLSPTILGTDTCINGQGDAKELYMNRSISLSVGSIGGI